MHGLRFLGFTALLVVGPTLVGCVPDDAGDGAGGSGGGGGTGSTTASPVGTSTGDATLEGSGSAGPGTAGEPADPPTSSATGSAGSDPTTGEPNPETSTSSDTTSATSTSGTSESEEPQPLGFESDIQPIFSDYCTCHGDGEPDPDLGIGRAYDNIVGVPASDVKGMVLVAPGSYEDSYLWHKIAGSQSQVGGAGKRMPPNDELQPADIAAIQQWITEGALP